jgi:hypothetical protein
LQDLNSYKIKEKIELPKDSLAKNINIGDTVFGKDEDGDEEIPYTVKLKNYFPSTDKIYLFVVMK